MEPTVLEKKDGWRVLQVKRPQEVEAKRYDLPVSTMEYEIMDSIRNHSVTIICSETGSGTSQKAGFAWMLDMGELPPTHCLLFCI